MAYQVIARKWRPQTFEEVTGQEHVTKTLANALSSWRIHHAYIFYGTRGVGKTTTARLLAKGLNCHKHDKPTAVTCSPKDDPCVSCREIMMGGSLDVLEIDAASNTGVDSVRETIVETLHSRAARDRYRVFIIDEVHMLTTAAFNALLKSVEEPPSNVVFIMATTEHHKLPKTILSRSQQFVFRSISTEKIIERLRLIANSEYILIGDDALREIARAGAGSMRDAQSALDQVISFAGDAIEPDDVIQALGIVPADTLAEIMESIAKHDPVRIMSIIDKLVSDGHNLRSLCVDLMTHVRDLIVAKATDSDELLKSALCSRPVLQAQAALFTESDLIAFFHSLTQTESQLLRAAQPRYVVEVGIVKLAEMGTINTIPQILERLEALHPSPPK